MPRPNSAVIFGPTGQVHCIVHPEREEQLDDPVWNKPDHLHIRMPLTRYAEFPEAENVDGEPHYHELMKACLEEAHSKHPPIAQKMKERVDKHEARMKKIKEE